MCRFKFLCSISKKNLQNFFLYSFFGQDIARPSRIKLPWNTEAQLGFICILKCLPGSKIATCDHTLIYRYFCELKPHHGASYTSTLYIYMYTCSMTKLLKQRSFNTVGVSNIDKGYNRPWDIHSYCRSAILAPGVGERFSKG